MIQLQNLTKSFQVQGGRHYVFRDVNVVFPEGVNIGILARTEVATTFMRLPGGIDYPDYGHIRSSQSFSWPLGLKGASLGI